ncbi:aldehyde dehydrogenase family protein [bacterium]|nr:aldehyde dehydrogenase family protein [bacterium]
MAFRITYSMLNADMAQVHQEFDAALTKVRAVFGADYPSWIAGRPVRSGNYLDDRNPADTRQQLAKFHKISKQDIDTAFSAARKAQAAWGDTPWKERVRLINKAADLISERRMELSAIMALEVGKNRLESLGDVEESADLLRYYGKSWEESDGFVRPLGKLSPNENTRSVLRPFGVFVVISPFNFPLALAAGMTSAALLGGNSVILKPSQDAPWCAQKLYECYRDAGIPEGVFQLIYGTGSELGDALTTHPECDGIAFTGSKEVGMRIYHHFSKDYVKPCLMELGGKNPTFVCETADIDMATDGCMRSAFGLTGQKCSALSRVYVHASRIDEFLTQLVEKSRKIRVGDPTDKDVYMGPLINARAVDKYLGAVAQGKKDGRILLGGEDLRKSPGFEHGHFVAPTIIQAPATSSVFEEEFFAPVLAVDTFTDLSATIARANKVPYGLTAGIFTGKKEEISLFMDRIQAGVLYANRRTGATTGAWPGVQAFCGWKGSGSTGKGGCGPYYASQFACEQSRTIME